MRGEPGQLIGGKYRLERHLASGGMGSVWVARHEELDVDVAVKFMAEELVGSERAAARFKQEARAAALLRSPNVVHIYDYGIESTAPYIVMELLKGEDLRARLEKHPRFSLAAASSLVTQAAKALQLAHDAGIIHRDLKPSNLFLARVGDDEVLKVLDFGIAKERTAHQDGEATTGVVLGSPAYMSPEHAGGRPVDHRSDLWSLSVVIFRILTGELPESDEGERRRASQLAPELPTEIDDFFERALARRAVDRFASARELAEVLATIAGTQKETVARSRLASDAPATPKTSVGRTSDTRSLAPDPDGGSLAGVNGAPKHAGRSDSRRKFLAGASALAAALGVAWWLGVRHGLVASESAATSSEPVASSIGSDHPAPPVLEPSRVASGGASEPSPTAERTVQPGPAFSTRPSPGDARPPTGPSATSSRTATPRVRADTAKGGGRLHPESSSRAADAGLATDFDPIFGIPVQK